MELFLLKAHSPVGHLSRCGLRKSWCIFLVLLLLLCSVCGHVSGEDFSTLHTANTHYSAIVNITYKDPVTGETISTAKEIGRYGQKSRYDYEWGYVVHVKTEENHSHGCTPPINVPKERWIALVQRGDCKFTKKIHNAAVQRNASAVVIYNNKHEPELLTMEQNGPNVDDVVSIFIHRAEGEHLAALVDNGTRVMMSITAGTQHSTDNYNTQINKTSVLFVSISFIVLMIISLAWLVFYYIQRFRYAHAKERLSKRLMHAAKKAISKMPARTIKNGDRELEADFDQCAICIEGYRASEVIRTLPCKHVFHKSCVDPWLIEQRSCPMCKTDILMAYGLQIHGSRESIVNIEVEGPSTSLGPFEILTSEGLREFDQNGVEVIRFQPLFVDLHNSAPAAAADEATNESAADPVAVETPTPDEPDDPAESSSLLQGAAPSDEKLAAPDGDDGDASERHLLVSAVTAETDATS